MISLSGNNQNIFKYRCFRVKVWAHRQAILTDEFVVLIFTIHILGQYRKLGYVLSFSHPFHFIIHLSPLSVDLSTSQVISKCVIILDLRTEDSKWVDSLCADSAHATIIYREGNYFNFLRLHRLCCMLQPLIRHLQETLYDMVNYYLTFIEGVQKERIKVVFFPPLKQKHNKLQTLSVINISLEKTSIIEVVFGHCPVSHGHDFP